MSQDRISRDDHVRDFTLEDTHGQLVKLSSYASIKNVYMVLNRGFA